MSRWSTSTWTKATPGLPLTVTLVRQKPGSPEVSAMKTALWPSVMKEASPWPLPLKSRSWSEGSSLLINLWPSPRAGWACRKEHLRWLGASAGKHATAAPNCPSGALRAAPLSMASGVDRYMTRFVRGIATRRPKTPLAHLQLRSCFVTPLPGSRIEPGRLVAGAPRIQSGVGP